MNASIIYSQIFFSTVYDIHLMPRQSSIANVGSMPFEAYIAKYEQTSDYVEDPRSFDNYQRDLLSDFRPEKPWLETDMPRNNDGYRKQRLNVQYAGGRSEIRPDLPDGTFLSHEFLEADPRGHTGSFDWNRYSREGIARARNVKFSNDDDYTTFESVIGDSSMSRRRKDMSSQFKQRWKNFTTAKESHSRGVLAPVQGQSRMCQVIAEGRDRLAEEGLCDTRSNIVAKLGNMTPMGYLTTGDHEFKIASWSQVRSSRSLREDDYNKNRRNTYDDRDDYVQYKDNAVPLSVARTMIDMSQKRYHETQSLRNYKFENSKESGPTREQKFVADRVKNAQYAEAKLANGPMQEMNSNVIGARHLIPKLDSNIKLKSKLTHETAEAMMQATRRSGSHEVGDLREQVQHSILHGESTDQSNRSVGKMITTSKWEGVEDRKISGTAEKTIFNFKKIKPKMYSLTDQVDNLVFDDYKSTSKSLDVRRLKHRDTMDRYESSHMDGIDFADQKSAANPAVGSGSRYTHNQVVRERADIDIFDI